MKKKLSLSNLNKTEIKKSEMKDALAGQMNGGAASKTYEYGGGAGEAAALPVAPVAPVGHVCTVLCYCTCFVGDVESTMDNVGIGGAINEYYYTVV